MKRILAGWLMDSCNLNKESKVHIKNWTNNKSQISRGDFIKTLGMGILANSVILNGCKNNDDEKEEISRNGLKAGEIVFAFYPSYYMIYRISFFATANKITIYWGGGQKEVNIAYNGKVFSYEYPRYERRIITCRTESLKIFRCVPEYDYATNDDSYLTELSFGKCTELTEIKCDNQRITLLDIENTFASLQRLVCSENQLTSLSVEGAQKLVELKCEKNLLTELNLRGCTALEQMDCQSNQLTELNLSGCTALEQVKCNSNQLTKLNLSGCTAMKLLQCDNNKLPALNFSGCTALEQVECNSNQLIELNVSGCVAIKSLHCYQNRLQSINMSGCIALVTLECTGNWGSNRITELNLSGCKALRLLICEANLLTRLDLSDCTELKYLFCAENYLSEIALNAIFESLPDRTLSDSVGTINFFRNPGTASCDHSIYERKNWEIGYSWGLGL